MRGWKKMEPSIDEGRRLKNNQEDTSTSARTCEGIWVWRKTRDEKDRRKKMEWTGRGWQLKRDSFAAPHGLLVR
jgi:hypothetical protein